jgi:hypothetical protein
LRSQRFREQREQRSRDCRGAITGQHGGPEFRLVQQIYGRSWAADSGPAWARLPRRAYRTGARQKAAEVAISCRATPAVGALKARRPVNSFEHGNRRHEAPQKVSSGTHRRTASPPRTVQFQRPNFRPIPPLLQPSNRRDRPPSKRFRPSSGTQMSAQVSAGGHPTVMTMWFFCCLDQPLPHSNRTTRLGPMVRCELAFVIEDKGVLPSFQVL